MNREEAIEFANEWLKTIDENEKDSLTYEFLTYVIHALQQEPCEDAISRQNATAQCFQAMELISGEFECKLSPEKKNYNAGLRKAIEIIRALPLVNPQPKTGHWIDTGSGQECSECGEIQHGYDNFRYFCANCGAKMEVVGNPDRLNGGAECPK